MTAAGDFMASPTVLVVTVTADSAPSTVSNSSTPNTPSGTISPITAAASDGLNISSTISTDTLLPTMSSVSMTGAASSADSIGTSATTARRLSGGAIAGAIIGSVAVAAAFAVVGYFFWRRQLLRRRKSKRLSSVGTLEKNEYHPENSDSNLVCRLREAWERLFAPREAALIVPITFDNDPFGQGGFASRRATLISNALLYAPGPRTPSPGPSSALKQFSTSTPMPSGPLISHPIAILPPAHLTSTNHSSSTFKPSIPPRNPQRRLSQKPLPSLPPQSPKTYAQFLTSHPISPLTNPPPPSPTPGPEPSALHFPQELDSTPIGTPLNTPLRATFGPTLLGAAPTPIEPPLPPLHGSTFGSMNPDLEPKAEMPLSVSPPRDHLLPALAPPPSRSEMYRGEVLRSSRASPSPPPVGQSRHSSKKQLSLERESSVDREREREREPEREVDRGRGALHPRVALQTCRGVSVERVGRAQIVHVKSRSDLKALGQSNSRSRSRGVGNQNDKRREEDNWRDISDGEEGLLREKFSFERSLLEFGDGDRGDGHDDIHDDTHDAGVGR